MSHRTKHLAHFVAHAFEKLHHISHNGHDYEHPIPVIFHLNFKLIEDIVVELTNFDRNSMSFFILYFYRSIRCVVM